MKLKMIAAVLAAAPLLAFAQGSAKGGGVSETVAKVNGVAVPKSRMDFMLRFVSGMNSTLINIVSTMTSTP